MKKIERIAALEQRVAALEAKLGVVEDETQKKAKPKLAVGQVWKMRNGETTEIVELVKGAKFPWWASGDRSYTDNGTYYYIGGSEYDLVELISDAPVPEQKAQEPVQVDTSVALPTPYTTPPARGRIYWAPNLRNGQAEKFQWDDDNVDTGFLKSGLAFKTKKDAVTVLKALTSFLKENTKVGE